MFLPLLLLIISPALGELYPSIHISQVKDLVLTKGDMTKGMRSIVPQLSCIGGPCAEVAVDVIACHAYGTDDTTGDPLWKCTTNLPAGVSLGRTEVICEGYSHPNDPYITRGSCGVEYILVGRPLHPPRQEVHHVHRQETREQPKPVTNDTSLWVTWVVEFFIWTMFILLGACFLGLILALICYSEPYYYYHAVPGYHGPTVYHHYPQHVTEVHHRHSPEPPSSVTIVSAPATEKSESYGKTNRR